MLNLVISIVSLLDSNLDVLTRFERAIRFGTQVTDDHEDANNSPTDFNEDNNNENDNEDEDGNCDEEDNDGDNENGLFGGSRSTQARGGRDGISREVGLGVGHGLNDEEEDRRIRLLASNRLSKTRKECGIQLSKMTVILLQRNWTDNTERTKRR